tara:strand:- start:264 stop:851 length:588 start_codon:yes stop_codon:yes gene_type:complete
MEKIDGIVEGWKIFNWGPGHKGDLMLSSIFNSESFIVPRRVNRALYKRGRFTLRTGYYRKQSLHQECPCEGYRCGFNILRYNQAPRPEIVHYPNLLIGRAYGWGKVIPGEHGFRCQYFYPKSLFGIIKELPQLNMNTLTHILYFEYVSSAMIADLIQPLKDSDAISLSSLWKIARLYKIQLEFEVPQWLKGEKIT